MSEALKVILASLNAFNTFAPSAGQLIVMFRTPTGKEIPLTEFADGIIQKNDANIARAEEYMASHPAED